MEALLENFLAYIIIISLIGIVFYSYLKYHKNKSLSTSRKIEEAKKFGFNEPVSLHPVINPDSCIGSGACVEACPEKDVLGIRNGQATTINASRCIGHGACFHACPVQAITLCIGTEKRGVELPHISREFESNIPGVFIAGELGGMGLVKNAVEQGKQAVEYIIAKNNKSSEAKYDLIIVGAGPAGISASLSASKNNLKFLTLEQDSLGGTVFNFPRAKIIMTSPMNLPLHGKVKLFNTSKSELLKLWNEILTKNNIMINEREKVLSIERLKTHFVVKTNQSIYNSTNILLAIGRRGSPRKLGILGEEKEKVYYRLLEPELINDKEILVVGGGDSAIESALLLSKGNNVTISYRKDSFSRLKPRNYERIRSAIATGEVKVIYNSNVTEIRDNKVLISIDGSNIPKEFANDLVYVFAGGELPVTFLEKIGIKITKKFGEVVLQH